MEERQVLLVLALEAWNIVENLEDVAGAGAVGTAGAVAGLTQILKLGWRLCREEVVYVTGDVS